MKNNLIRDIIEKEWNFFQQVQGVDGRAACQDDKITFEIMRKSQFLVLSEDFLHLYLKDLIIAENENRNPISEKYAYMMRETDKEYFEKQLKDRLPECSPIKRNLLNAIAEIVRAWDEDLRRGYPGISTTIRPEKTTSKSVSLTSYLICELETCSEETVQSYFKYAEDCVRSGRNLQIETVEQTAELYGFKNLKQVESALKK